MKLRGIIASALALALTSSLAFAQTNPGSSPLSVPKGGTGAGSFTSGLPLVGNGSGALSLGTRTGNSARYVSADATSFTATNCAQWDANGNLTQNAAPCGTGTNVSYAQDFIAGTDFTAGTTTSLTVSNTPLSTQSTTVYFDGVRQSANTWSLSVATVTFLAAIPANTKVVEIASLSSTVLPTWVTSIGALTGNVLLGSGLSVSGQTVNATVGENLLNNSGFGLTTLISTVLVSNTPSAPLYIPITSFATVGGAGSNTVGFNTTSGPGPLGVGGLTSGKLVAIMGGTANISFTATVTGGNTITATSAVFTQGQGDLIWITGGTNTSPRTQFRVTATASGGGTILQVNGTLVNEASKTFTATVIQGGYALDQSVNGYPQAGNPSAPAFYYYPLQVTSVGSNTFNAAMAGKDLNAGATSTGSAWEVTNGVQGTGSPGGPDWWLTSTSLSWYKMRGYDWDGTTAVTKPGSQFSVKIYKGATAQEFFYYDLTAPNPGSAGYTNADGLSAMQGKTVTFGGWIWTPNASQGRLYIDDGTTKTYSAYVSSGSYQWVEVTATLSSTATKAQVGFSLDTGAIGDRFFFTQPIAILGSGPIGSANYKPAPASFKMFLNHVNPFYYLGRTVPANTYINIEQETCGLIQGDFGAIQSDLEAYNNVALSSIYLTNNALTEMTALTLYNQTISTTKAVNTMVVGVGKKAAGGGSGFHLNTHYIRVNNANFVVNVDYLGGLYR